MFQNKLELGKSLRMPLACVLFQTSPQVQNSLETFCLFTGKEGAAFSLSHFAIKTKDSEVKGRAQEPLSPHQHCDESDVFWVLPPFIIALGIHLSLIMLLENVGGYDLLWTPQLS